MLLSSLVAGAKTWFGLVWVGNDIAALCGESFFLLVVPFRPIELRKRRSEGSFFFIEN